MGITVFFSLYTTRLILNALGAVDYGIYGIVGGAIGMLGFLNSSMSDATLRFMSYSQGKKDYHSQKCVFVNSIIINIVIAVILAIILELVSYPLFHFVLTVPSDRLSAAEFIYQFLIVSTFFTVVSVPYDAAIIAHENMRYYAIIGIVESLLKFFVAVIVVNTLLDRLILYGVLMASLTIVVFLSKYLYCHFTYDECKKITKTYANKITIFELLGYARWNLINSLGTLVGNHGSDVVLNHFFGPAINSAGNIGAQLRGQMMALSNGLLKALNPAILKIGGEGDKKQIMNFSVSGAKFSYILFAVFCIPFIIDAPYVLRVWLKNVPEWTLSFSRLLMLTGLGEQMTITMGTALAATGEIRNNSLFSGFAHIIPLFIYIIIYQMGVQPIWTYVITFFNFVFIIGGYKLYQCANYCNLNICNFIRTVFLPICICSAIALIVGVLILYTMQESILRFLIIVTVVDTIFLGSSYFVIIDDNEKSIIRSVVLITKEKCKSYFLN